MFLNFLSLKEKKRIAIIEASEYDSKKCGPFCKKRGKFGLVRNIFSEEMAFTFKRDNQAGD